MSASIVYENQQVVYKYGLSSISLEPLLGLVIREDLTTLIVNQLGFTNGVQSLLFSDLYAGVQKTQSIQFATSTPTSLNIRDNILINDILDDFHTSIHKNNITITDTTTSDYASFGYDGMTIDTISGTTNTLTSNSVQIDGTTNSVIIQANTNIINQSCIAASDNANYATGIEIGQLFSANISAYPTIVRSTMSPTTIILGASTTTSNEVIISNDINVGEPFIQLTNSGGHANYLRFNSLNADGHYCYSFTNNERFFKQNNPFSFRQVELLLGDYIEKDYPFVFCQNVLSIKLRPVSEYLDDLGNAGWSCIVSNYSGGDLNIDMNDASSWYSFSNGSGLGNPITLNKWVTCRITLIYSSIDNQFIWAVSQY